MNLKRSLNDPYKVASICYALYGFVYLCGAVIELSPDRMRPGFGFLPWWSFYLMGLVVLVTFPVIIWKRYRGFIRILTVFPAFKFIWLLRGQMILLSDGEPTNLYNWIFMFTAFLASYFLFSAGWSKPVS